ncbi:MAG: TonB-dependent receptor [Hyphomicrobiaceae bacterium]|nr:TonB-dependent receptor [Hyphomicrobiaceae bacterium]
MRHVSVGSKFGLLLSASVLVLVPSEVAVAQDSQTSDELIVYGTVVHRNRTESVAPTLSYDLEYFQRFEPISAGDALKRVPGVSFTSDTLEYDQVQLRGLPSIYTQIQVNGTNLDGPGSDRVFFADRIPAELIDSIEIVRAPSADMSSEGIGGTVNVNLKRAGQITGGWVRGSGFTVAEDKLRGAGSVGYGNTFGETSYLFSVDVQQRRNPKRKTSSVFDADGAFEEFATQQDTRDGTDYAFNGEVATKVGDGVFRLYGFAVLTDRDENEFTKTFEVDNGVLDLDEVATQHEAITQRNVNIVGEYKLPVGRDEVFAKFGYTRFTDDLDTVEYQGDTENELELDAIERIDTKDQDWFGTLAYTLNSSIVSVKVGVDGRVKTRDFGQTLLDGDLEDESLPNGQFDVRENRIDPYVKATWSLLPGLKIETGLRYENTFRELSGNHFGTTEQDFHEWNPSVHALYALTETTNLRASVARTVRRPSFDILVPATLLEEPDDEDATIGNPNLEQETAWGFDVGVDQRLGLLGILGVNVFDREIKDVIERVGTGETVTVDGDDFNVFTYRNFSDGRAYGVEVDFSAPLTVVGLPETSIFANYTWLKSEVTDPITGRTRRFRDQPEYIYNIGMIQNVPDWDSTFGVSYQKRGASLAFDFNEVEETTYAGNLEAFVERRFGKDFVVRFTAANLLDAEKIENKQAFDPDLNGQPDGLEVERETSGPLFLLTARKSF